MPSRRPARRDRTARWRRDNLRRLASLKRRRSDNPLDTVLKRTSRLSGPGGHPGAACSGRGLLDVELCTRRFGALFRQAKTSAVRRVLFFAARSCTFVASSRPHAPLNGAKTLGSAQMKDSCCSGVSLTIAHPCPAGLSVAKIFPPTRKSGLTRMRGF